MTLTLILFGKTQRERHWAHFLTMVKPSKMIATIKSDGLFEAGPSRLADKENYTSECSASTSEATNVEGDILVDDESSEHEDELEEGEYDEAGFVHGMDHTGFIGDKTLLKPLTPEALAVFKAAQDRAGVVYISRIPPGMQPAKVRHLMGKYGEVGRVYLQQEGISFSFATGLSY